MDFLKKTNNNQAFTLIELLVVIAILSILAVAVTLILNPAELMRQARDSTRLSDLATINKALSLYQTDQIDGSMGNSQTVYTSLPDTDSTCSSYDLPSLPSGWSYHCVSSASTTRVDGNGWIPVDFTQMSFQSPLSRLPLDPINSATTTQYYTYAPGGSWELSTVLEANTHKMGGSDDKTSTDGGDYPEVYEVGTDLELDPVNRDPNLVGYWKFDEGSGTTAYDSSGNGNDGTLTNGPIWSTDAREGNYSLSFDGVDDYVDVGNSQILQMDTSFSISFWVKINDLGGDSDENSHEFVTKGHGLSSPGDKGWAVSYYYGSKKVYLDVYKSDGSRYNKSLSYPQNDNWHHIFCTFDEGIIGVYINGSGGRNDYGNFIIGNTEY